MSETTASKRRRPATCKRTASPEPSLPPSAQLVRACAKCHERKVKCGGELPRCANCARLDVPCNVAECVLWSHDYVGKLEARVRWLEELVSRAYVTEDIGKVASGALLVPKRSFQSAPEHLPDEVGQLSLRAAGCYMGSMSGVTFGIIINSAIRLFQDDPLSVDPEAAAAVGLHRPSRAVYPPLALARTYVANYLESTHRWHPFLDLERLGWDLEAVYAGHKVTQYAKYTLLMICALGSSGMSSHGDAADPYSPADYVCAALGFLPVVVGQGGLDAIRALLLVSVWGLQSWENDGQTGINLWQVTGHAMRLAVEMGITRNNPKWDFGDAEQEARRRVLWSAYGLERYVATLTGRTISVRRQAIDAQYPERLDEVCPRSLAPFLHTSVLPLDLRPAIHLIKQRQLLGEVLETVYQARSQNCPSPTVQETTLRVFQIQADLVAWAQDVYTTSADGTVERDVLQLAFHHATLLLHRPSPSFPAPSPEAVDVCLGAARGMIKLCDAALARGAAHVVFPGWAGFANVLMSGLALIYCSWIQPCAQSVKSLAPGAMDAEIATSLAILETLAPRSPHTQRYIHLYTQVIVAFDRILGAQLVTPLAHGPDVDMTFVAAALHNSGFANLESLDLDEESLNFIARLLAGDPGV